MDKTDYTTIEFQSRKRYEIQQELKIINTLIKSIQNGELLLTRLHMEELGKINLEIIKMIQKNNDLLLTDPNNCIVDKKNIRICFDYEQFFYYQIKECKVWDGVEQLKLIEDPFDLSNFIPKQIPLYGKGNYIVDYGKIEAFTPRKYYFAQEPIYVRYSFGDLRQDSHVEIKLLGYPLDPVNFQHYLMCEFNRSARNYDFERTDNKRI